MTLNQESVHIESPKVICFGEALLDRLGPLGGKNALDPSTEDCLGGAPANVVCALARLGVEVAFVGRLGEDEIGNNFRELMIARGVNIACLQNDSHLPTRIVKVDRDEYGERSFGGFVGESFNKFSDAEISLDELELHWKSIAKNAKWLVTGTIPLAYNSSSEALMWVIRKALKEDIQIGIDVNWRPTFWDSHLRPDSGPNDYAREKIQLILEKASLIKLSKEEAIWFFNTAEPLQISRSLSQRPNIVVTDGAFPIRWQINNLCGTSEPHKSPLIVDTTGAGDAFMAGLISQITKNPQNLFSYQEIQKAIVFAAGCGAIVCSGKGAIGPQPTYEQVIKFISSDLGGNS
tara:strand:- start:14610 stop:15653 length:1044 start_codon:yes stop_codon:yes gene_type:complete